MAQKNRKKIITIVLLVIMLVAILTVVGVIVIPKLTAKPYFFGYGENEDGTCSVAVVPEFEKNDKKIDVITIPSEHDGKPITKIRDSKGSLLNEINEIIVPDSVQIIENGAFGQFVNLKKLTLPSTLKEIGGHIAPGSVELNFQSNDYFTFENGCIVEKSTNTAVFGVNGCIIPDTVNIIGEDAFWHVEIANSSLPSGITKIESAGFFGSQFNFDKLVLANTILEIGMEAFSYSTGFNKTLQISTRGNINSYAFESCSINTLIYDVVPKVVGDYKVLHFSSQITAYYENENMPVLSTSKQIESDLEGYRKYKV